MLEHDPEKWKPVFRIFANRHSPPSSNGILLIFPKPAGLCNRFPQVSARLGLRIMACVFERSGPAIWLLRLVVHDAYAPRISR
jgi:hypothetical protein